MTPKVAYAQLSEAELRAALNSPPLIVEDLRELLRVCAARGLELPPHLQQPDTPRAMGLKALHVVGALLAMTIATGLAKSRVIPVWVFLIAAGTWIVWWLYRDLKIPKKH
jgi:hypothetical protein